MRLASKNLRQELKRLDASLKDLQAPKKKKEVSLRACMKCKQDAGKNFFFMYKKDNTLKGKVCKTCADKGKEKPAKAATVTFMPIEPF